MTTAPASQSGNPFITRAENAAPPTLVTFAQALEAAKQGKRIARNGWNGKGMWVYVNKGSMDKTGLPPHHEGQAFSEGIDLTLFESGDAGTCTRLPNLNMVAATGSTVTGWLASQTDLLADDWVILE